MIKRYERAFEHHIDYVNRTNERKSENQRNGKLRRI